MFCVLLYRVQSRGGETRRVWQLERKEKREKKNKESEQRNSVHSLGSAVGVERGCERKRKEDEEEEEERSSGLNMQHVAGWSSQLHNALRLKSAVNK